MTHGRRYDVVFTDTCLGGSTVARRAAAAGRGLRGCYLADYAVNPLGVKSGAEVRAALERWVRFAAPRGDTLVVSCNTASVGLEQSPDVRGLAARAGLRLFSMVDLLDAVLASHASVVGGQRVCVMGTRFTVSQPVYRDRLIRAGALEVIPLAATRSERTIARLAHQSAEGRQVILEETSDAIRRADVVVLACTLFPLVAGLLHEMNPRCLLLDPAEGVQGVLPGPQRRGPNRLDVTLTGSVILGGADVTSLFEGWTSAVTQSSDALLDSAQMP